MTKSSEFVHLGRVCLTISLIAAAALLGGSVAASAVQSEPVTTCNDGSSSEPLAIIYGGHTDNCRFDSNSDTDSFRFTATEGEIVQVKAYDVTTGVDLALQVRDPGGQIVASETCFSNCCGNCWILKDLDIGTTGVYTIAITERDQNNVGDYRLQLERVFPAAEHPSLAYDQPVEDILSPSSDSDVYTFEGSAGTVVRATASSKVEGQDMRILVYAPSGEQLTDTACFANCCGVCAASKDLALTESGKYSLVVMEDGANFGAAYNVSLTCLSGLCPGPRDESFEGAIEEPSCEGASGVSNVRGWIFSRGQAALIAGKADVFIDGAFATQIPCCSNRGDVKGVFPEAPLDTGFSGIFNWSLLAPGTHDLEIRVPSSTGNTLVLRTQFRSYKPAQASFLQGFEWSDDEVDNCVSRNGATAELACSGPVMSSAAGQETCNGGLLYVWDRGAQGLKLRSNCVPDPMNPPAPPTCDSATRRSVE